MITELILPHIRALTPYSTARDEFSGEASIYLDANENPFPSRVNRYPDPHHRAIKARLSELKRVTPEQLLIANGSDEAIDLLLRTTCAPGDPVITMPPTYGMYKVAAAGNNLRVRQVPLTPSFDPDLTGIAANRDAKLLFACSPNNPTGNQLSLKIIEEILTVFPGIVVVDEAYIDFAAGPSALELLGRYERLVVLQTLSKAWGLAGARLGYAIGHPELIAAISRLKAPYNVNSLTQEIVLERLAQSVAMKTEVSLIVEQRRIVERALRELPNVENVFPSEANFLLVRFSDGDAIFEFLKAHGVIVRNRGGEPGCERCLRVTIGTPQENEHLIKLLVEKRS
jgi:histidinol-phosphate aminotransferase